MRGPAVGGKANRLRFANTAPWTYAAIAEVEQPSEACPRARREPSVDRTNRKRPIARSALALSPDVGIFKAFEDARLGDGPAQAEGGRVRCGPFATCSACSGSFAIRDARRRSSGIATIDLTPRDPGLVPLVPLARWQRSELRQHRLDGESSPILLFPAGFVVSGKRCGSSACAALQSLVPRAYPT